MKVHELMTPGPNSCRSDQSLHEAATSLWQHHIGCLPVVDAERRPIAMLTDRDICMASLHYGHLLTDLTVEQAMAKRIFTCAEDDDITAAERTMRDWQVSRLPVVDGSGKLVGLLSMSDIVSARWGGLGRLRERLLRQVGHTLVALVRKPKTT